jgi:RNA polymerase sigma-70 factor (ECF subfamily)
MENAKLRILDGYAKEIIRYKARLLIGKYGFTRDDFEDLQQDMILDLLGRLAHYDPDKATLKTFVACIVERKISTIIRHQTSQKRHFRRLAGSLDDPVSEEERCDTELGDTISQDDFDRQAGLRDGPQEERRDMEMEVRRAIADLPEDLRQVADLLQSLSVSQTAQELGVHRSTVYVKGITRLRKLFEDRGLKEFLENRPTHSDETG